MNDISEEAKRELLSRFMEFSGQTIACAYWYAKALSDYGINIAERWKTITQQKAALDSAYVQGRNDEAKRFNNSDVRPVVRGKWLPDYDYTEYDYDGSTPLPEPRKFQDGWKCSLCGAYEPSTVNFCPNCGARMEES